MGKVVANQFFIPHIYPAIYNLKNYKSPTKDIKVLIISNLFLFFKIERFFVKLLSVELLIGWN